LFIKQALVGTSLGRLLMAARNRTQLLQAAVWNPVQLGAVVNDQLAAKLVARICQPARTFVDVGAHIGSVMSEANYYTSCKVIAIEAISDKAANLRRRFPWATVHACAVGDREGEASFFVDRSQSGYSSLGSHRSGAEEIRVPIRRLDTLVTTDDVDVIKIDVEGAELGVLLGAEAIISRFRPVVLFESAPTNQMYPRENLWLWFQDRNYTVLPPDRLAHNGPGLTAEGFDEAHWYPRRATNYFAVPRERRDVVRRRARRILGIDPMMDHGAEDR